MRTSTPDSVPNPAAMRAKSVFGGGSHREETVHSGGELLLTSHITVFKGRENTATGIVKDLNTQLGKKLRIRQVQRGHIVLEGQVTAQQVTGRAVPPMTGREFSSTPAG